LIKDISPLSTGMNEGIAAGFLYARGGGEINGGFIGNPLPNIFALRNGCGTPLPAVGPGGTPSIE
jgi:hypothetical protein